MLIAAIVYFIIVGIIGVMIALFQLAITTALVVAVVVFIVIGVLAVWGIQFGEKISAKNKMEKRFAAKGLRDKVNALNNRVMALDDEKKDAKAIDTDIEEK